jgi:hypothetical protein
LLYYKDARVHCEVLNTRAETQPTHPPGADPPVRTESPPPHQR